MIFKKGEFVNVSRGVAIALFAIFLITLMALIAQDLPSKEQFAKMRKQDFSELMMASRLCIGEVWYIKRGEGITVYINPETLTPERCSND